MTDRIEAPELPRKIIFFIFKINKKIKIKINIKQK